MVQLEHGQHICPGWDRRRGWRISYFMSKPYPNTQYNSLKRLETSKDDIQDLRLTSFSTEYSNLAKGQMSSPSFSQGISSLTKWVISDFQFSALTLIWGGFSKFLKIGKFKTSLFFFKNSNLILCFGLAWAYISQGRHYIRRLMPMSGSGVKMRNINVLEAFFRFFAPKAIKPQYLPTSHNNLPSTLMCL